jgi:hypothetical protein
MPSHSATSGLATGLKFRARNNSIRVDVIAISIFAKFIQAIIVVAEEVAAGKNAILVKKERTGAHLAAGLLAER